MEGLRPDIRYLNEMKGVLYDKKWAKNAPNLELYYMYRGVKRKGGLRYDITIIPPQMLGSEFVKTLGHGHCKNYGEIYTVLAGKAIYLIQKYTGNQIKDVYAVEAKKGESVIIPPHFSHFTINPSTKEQLKEANWLDERCQNVYDLIIKKRGACYYYTKKGWIKNKNYRKVPKLRFQKPLKSPPKDLSFVRG